MTLEPGTYSIDLPAKHEKAFTEWRTANKGNVGITIVEPSSDHQITQYTFTVKKPVTWLENVAAPSKGGPKDVTPTSDEDYPAEEDPLDVLQKAAKDAAKFTIGFVEIAGLGLLAWFGWKAIKGELGGPKK
jgi:hypothetical protein